MDRPPHLLLFGYPHRWKGTNAMTLTTFRQVSADPGVSRLDELAAPDARAVLGVCCGSSRWVERMEALRPYRTRGRLVDLSDAVTRRLEWIEVRQALTSFPRLGDVGYESGRLDIWARREQQDRDTSEADGDEQDPLARAVALGAREYEKRFGFVFLICSQGRTAQQTLAALSTRLNNEPRMERLVVRAELAAIARARLVRLLANPPRTLRSQALASSARPASGRAAIPAQRPAQQPVRGTWSGTIWISG
jgi:2-oxo-4-hydroxy-4-carboxy-5-ureidoimidazoline decarboxylase